MITDNDTRRAVRESTVKACAMHDWCQVDHSRDQDAEDRAYHRKTVTAGAIEVAFTVQSAGPSVLWMPDFFEWSFSPDEAGDLAALADSFREIHSEFLAFIGDIGTQSRPEHTPQAVMAKVDAMTVSELRSACVKAGLPLSTIARAFDGDERAVRALSDACEAPRELRRPIDVHERLSGLGDL